MSSKRSNNPTAEDAIEQFLRKRSGWHEVKPIANQTGYTSSHICTTGTRMAKNNNYPVKRRKNRNKPVIAYIFPGNWEIPGSDRQNYIRLIRMHSNNPPSNLHSMSLSELQSELGNVADGKTVAEHKVEFRIP